MDRVARHNRSELAELRKRYELLTPREREVLPFVTAGLLNKQTAAELGTAEITKCIGARSCARWAPGRSRSWSGLPISFGLAERPRDHTNM